MTATTERPGIRSQEFDPSRHVSGVGSVLAGTANVVLQLSWPEVGHGVVESRVESGQVTRHPLKRARTTFTYLAVALFGDDEDRRVYRRAVGTSHAQVRSGPESPVAYDAFDPELQRWVAACLYWGTADLAERLHGQLDERAADALYAHCARFGTTLQMRADAWPADRGAFAAYWTASLDRVRIDPPVRDYLVALIRQEFLPRPLRGPLGRLSTFWTTGFLPEPFRQSLGLSWTARDQARFDRRLRRLGRWERALPLGVRRFPFPLLLQDLRRRSAAGRPLV